MSGLVGVRAAAIGLLTLGLVAQACGGDSGGNGGGKQNNGGESSEAGAGTGDAGSGAKPGGGSVNGGGDGPGAGGEGGAPPVVVTPVVEKPRNGTAIVVDGTIATSENFRVILTLGEGPSGNTTMKSAQHRVDLGVIGSTQ